METGEVIYEKVYMSPRRPSKISLKHDWMKELGPEDAQRPDGQVVQQFNSQLNQPNPNPDHDGTVQPVVGADRKGQPVVGSDPRTAQGGRETSRSQEIETRSCHEEAVEHGRTGQPVVETGAPQTHSSDDSTNFNVGDETNHDRTGRPDRYQSSTRTSLRLCGFCVVSWKGPPTSKVQ